MNLESWVTAYAAIVATGALALEVRRWFETGPRIKLGIQPNMIMVGGKQAGKDEFVAVTVRNRGTIATTVTTLAMVKYPNRFYRFVRSKGSYFVIPKPTLGGHENSIPYVLEPGQQWVGMIKKTVESIDDFESGTVVIEVYTSDRDRGYRKTIPRNKTKKPTLIENE